MTGTIKRTLKKAVTGSPMLLRTLNSFAAKKPRVLMYHRFAPPGRPVPHRVTADVFAWQLDVISRDFRVISLGECIAHYTAQREWPQGCVVLTIDDGYRDVYQWAYPELVKRNLSATFFVTTGFVDGAIWLWPDRIDYALRHTGAASCVVPVGGREVRVYLTDATERFKAWRALSDHCIALEDDSRRSYLARMEEVLGVELPQLPPP